MMDFGFPQTTESKILQEYITQESHKLEVQARPPMAVTNAVSWRSEGIRYRKNEVFLDVVESVNLLVNASGNVIRSEILGAVKMKCYLSGMPELRLGLNDKVMFESTGRGELSFSLFAFWVHSGWTGEWAMGRRDTDSALAAGSRYYLAGKLNGGVGPKFHTNIQRPAANQSKWKTSNSTNASVYPDSKMTVPSRSSPLMGNSN